MSNPFGTIEVSQTFPHRRIESSLPTSGRHLAQQQSVRQSLDIADNRKGMYSNETRRTFLNSFSAANRPSTAAVSAAIVPRTTANPASSLRQQPFTTQLDPLSYVGGFATSRHA